MVARLRNFFFPPSGSPKWRWILPYATLAALLLIMLLGISYVWEYTNSPEFCGTSCHTMPPEYAAYQVSPHARVACVECHIGRDFIATRITRKAGDLEHVFSMLFSNYELPIFADKLRPARETCELCHYPSKFSDDSLRELKRFLEDEENTPISIFLALRTGGGAAREGLGRGIHWHIENEIWFVAEDELAQSIPYVRVVGPDGEEDVYVALNASASAEELAKMEQEQMDCLACHNRISHNILPPYRAVAQALDRDQIDVDIPYIYAESVEVLSAEYETDDEAHEALTAFPETYADAQPEAYAEYESGVTDAAEVLRAIYDDSVFREQKVDWQTHPNNIGHLDWPGCFRCHDGQHINQDGKAIRLECNLCHSIPLVVEPGTIEPDLPLVTGIQPESHFNTHWIALHRESFDQSCQACHTVDKPGGTDNSSFCANAMCHGVAWEFAGLDAPGLSEVLAANRPEPTPESEPEPETEPKPDAEPDAVTAPTDAGDLTFDGQIKALFDATCNTCHNEAVATGGLILATYEGVTAGGKDGAVIVPGDAEASRLVEIQRAGHFGTFDDEALQTVIEWIDAGAPE